MFLWTPPNAWPGWSGWLHPWVFGMLLVSFNGFIRFKYASLLHMSHLLQRNCIQGLPGDRWLGVVAVVVVCLCVLPLQGTRLSVGFTRIYIDFSLLNMSHAVVGYWHFMFFSDLPHLLLNSISQVHYIDSLSIYIVSCGVISCHFHMLTQAGFPWPTGRVAAEEKVRVWKSQSSTWQEQHDWD